MRRPEVAALLVCATLVGGCASQLSSRVVRTGPLPVTTTPNGHLTSGPVALTLSDVARLPPDSPERLVMQILFDIEWGYAPDATQRVDPAVVNAFGAGPLRSAFRLLRPTVVVGYPVLGRQRFLGNGVVLNVSLLTVDHPPAGYVFVLRRRGGRWYDVYDSASLLGVALAAEQRIQSLDRPLSRRASRAGTRAESRYRTLASTLLGGVGLPGPTHP